MAVGIGFSGGSRSGSVFLNQMVLCPSAFLGNSLSAILDGKARLLFMSRGEEYVITMPYAHCKGRATVNVDDHHY